MNIIVNNQKLIKLPIYQDLFNEHKIILLEKEIYYKKYLNSWV